MTLKEVILKHGFTVSQSGHGITEYVKDGVKILMSIDTTANVQGIKRQLNNTYISYTDPKELDSDLITYFDGVYGILALRNFIHYSQTIYIGTKDYKEVFTHADSPIEVKIKVLESTGSFIKIVDKETKAYTVSYRHMSSELFQELLDMNLERYLY